MKKQTSIPLQQSKLSLRLCSTFILAVLACYVLPRAAHAQCTNTCTATNTALGSDALFGSGGGYNSAFGAIALSNDSTGTSNTAFGYAAVSSVYDISDNTAVGSYALVFTTTGFGQNTAIGSQALKGGGTSDNSASFNTATGFSIAVFNYNWRLQRGQRQAGAL